jgi:chromosome segregation ATPase
MQIHIHNVVIRNFLSFGNNPTTFEIRDGINLISGYNEDTGRSNGSGKSNLIESIV